MKRYAEWLLVHALYDRSDSGLNKVRLDLIHSLLPVAFSQLGPALIDLLHFRPCVHLPSPRPPLLLFYCTNPCQLKY